MGFTLSGNKYPLPAWAGMLTVERDICPYGLPVRNQVSFQGIREDPSRHIRERSETPEP